MKQFYVFLAVALGLLLLPKGTDAAKLAPAQVVQLYTEDEKVVIRTDLGNTGEGNSVESAFADLKVKTPGRVFLDTAKYLLIDENAEPMLPELEKLLKGGCRVCISDGVEDLESAAEYLDAHPPAVQLKACIEGAPVREILEEKDGQFRLYKNKS